MISANQYIHAYLTAAARIYGKISLAELLQLYCEHNNAVNETDFMVYARTAQKGHASFVLLNDQHIYCSDAEECGWQIVSPMLAYGTWDSLFTIEAAQEGLPLCKLTREQILAYADDAYWPCTEQGNDMLDYLKRYVTGSAEPGQLLEEVLLQAQDDKLADTCLHELQRMGAVFGPLDQRREFVWLYRELSRVVRKPVFRGHTQEELEQRSIPRERIEQHYYEWFCPPLRRDQEIADRVLMTDAEPCGSSRRRQLALRTMHERAFPPKLFEPCFCGSGLFYGDCCGKR